MWIERHPTQHILTAFACLLMVTGQTFAQTPKVPKVHQNITVQDGQLGVEYKGNIISENDPAPTLTLKQVSSAAKGTSEGISFDFDMPNFQGTLYYGFIPYGDSKHPHPVFFKRTSPIEGGKATIKIAGNLEGRYDMIDWATRKQGTLGYRIMAENGTIIYDGKVAFTGNGPFKVVPTVIEGPFVNKVTPTSAVISFETQKKTKATVTIQGKTFEDAKSALHHEIEVADLLPNTEYTYTVESEGISQTYTFQTAPEAGSRTSFSFCYASDSRSGQGGGERDIYGANAYIMKKIMALAKQQDVKFMQFSGDLIDGYLTSPMEINLQYANWKHAIEPFAHYFPVYVSMGNHEALMRTFVGEKNRVLVDRFPYETESAEAIFANHFVQPTNGPASEDGASYDPRPNKTDFPPYDENVFSYSYDNVGFVVLNSDYWYAPNAGAIPLVGGGLHGYLMDQQMEWLKETLTAFENDPNIDHVFVTQHTPAFPNGGHVSDDMWYRGNNDMRPYVAGQPLGKGIIERRDEYLTQLINEHTKVIAILTGDEHNYARTEIGPETPIYDEKFPENMRVKLDRTIYQVNNGAAGAPYYAQEQTPWSEFVSGFTTQNALVFFDVDGKKLSMRVLNPDTLEEIDTLTLRNGEK
ncbi:metallophosphoesterase [Pontibacter sp. G13]|uniref:metallophosphoesterase n=1 Tax=Pontibacter sp. G13 TaxID=3074898 RepID=UPI00288A12A2|nr:metallophosphoesterase [Pontibacter sp. G13]WNJ19219.1 metallophosphoesterase [Pontibacter sp. G13]